jgi:voltage-gated potassium channel
MKRIKYIIFALLFYSLTIILIGLIEQKSDAANIKKAGDAFWYAIVTLTTVGYGDYYPVTPAGRVLGLFLIIGSVGILGYLISEITAKFNHYMEKKNNGYWGVDFENHYIIIGYNDFGRQVAQQIINTGHKVAFIVNSKNDLDLVKDVFKSDQSFCMFADYNNMEAYNKVNIAKSKGVFINFKEDTETLVFVLDLKKNYPSADVVVTCKNPNLKETFKNAGIQYVISQSEVASRLVASYIFEPQVAVYTEDLISSSALDNDFDIQQYKVVEANRFIGQSFIDVFLQLKQDYNAVLIGLVVDNKLIKNPPNDHVIKAGEYFILISDGNCKKILEKEFHVKEGE